MHRINYIAIVLMVFAVAGCATGPSYQKVANTLPQLEPDKGRIYFYRSGSPFGSAVQPSVYLNGQKVGDAVPGGVYFKDVEPGEYEVKVETEVERKINFPIKVGQSRYIKFTVSMGFFAGRVRPSLVDRIQGAEDIKGLAYIGGQS